LRSEIAFDDARVNRSKLIVFKQMMRAAKLWRIFVHRRTTDSAYNGFQRKENACVIEYDSYGNLSMPQRRRIAYRFDGLFVDFIDCDDRVISFALLRHVC